MEAQSRSAELLFFDLEPLTHRTVTLISVKLSLALIQYIIVLYGLCHLSHKRSTNLLRKVFVSLPIRPSTKKAERRKTDMLLLTRV